MFLSTGKREAAVSAVVRSLEDRRLTNEEMDKVHTYNAQSYIDHIAGVSAGVVSILVCQNIVKSPGKFKLVGPPLAGLSLFAAYSLVSNYRMDTLLSELAAATSTTSLARRLRRTLQEV